MEETLPVFLLMQDTLLSLVGFVVFLVDVALDIWAVVTLYQEGYYISMGLLLFLLLGSSVLLQIFSWIWYSDPSITLETKVEKFAKRHGLLGLLHIFQLGVFLRCVVVMELCLYNLKQPDLLRGTVAGFYDLNMLRLFETFAESAPQLVLMIHTLIIQEENLQFVTVAKVVGCFAAIAINMTFFHRSMRHFVPEVDRMDWLSSLVYFLWNLLLISPRVVALALFASALPCYIAVHFLCVWSLLVLWAWWQDTNYMENTGNEWLYRATVGLIWYFSWFNVAEGRTKLKSITYHLCMGLDMAMLMVLWWGKQSMESARQSPLLFSPYVLLVAVPALYVAGIALKLLYYWKCHPKQRSVEIIPPSPLEFRPAAMDGDSGDIPEHEVRMPYKEPEVIKCSSFESRPSVESKEDDTVVLPTTLDTDRDDVLELEASLQPQTLSVMNQRMKKMAAHFYH